VNAGKFLKNHDAGIMLLGGITYLISRFGFDIVYPFIQKKQFDFLDKNTMLTLSLNLATLN
jgi:hypothetical protein